MNSVFGMNLTFPKQRLSYTEKIADDNKWGKQMIDLLVTNSNSDHTYVSPDSSEKLDRYNKMISNYQLYNNILNQRDFEQECNPLGIEVGQFKDQIKPYNKTPNKINVLLGEEIKRPFNFKTVLTNSEGIKSKQEYKKKLLEEYINSYVTSILKKFNPQIGEPDPQTGEIIKPEHIEEYMKYSYTDSREHLDNQILQYLIRKENIQDKRNDSFKHGLVSGEEHLWVGVENGEPVVKVLNPLGVFFHKSSESKYVEDGLYAGFRTRMTSGDVIDRFGEYLTEKDLNKVEGRTLGENNYPAKDMRYNHTEVTDAYMQDSLAGGTIDQGSYGKPKSEDWVVTHVEWRSQKKVGFVTYTNEEGDEITMIVSEDFKVPSYAKIVTSVYHSKNLTKYEFDGMTLEWAWIPEIWEGIKIGDNIYCCIGPKNYQYRSIDNPHKIKLGYHGLVYSAMNAEPISLMERMKPFQYLYFIIAHKLKRLIARDKGQIFHFDLSMVPESIGLEKTIYYLEEMDIDFYNPLANAETPGSYQRGKVTGSTSRSNMQHILNYVQLMAAIDEQINDVAGITRNREGQTSPNQAVGNAQQDLMMSSTITEAIYFKPHDYVWESALNSLIQCAQVVWKDKNIVKQYVLDDLSIQTLEVPSESLVNADLGVFISNSSRDVELFSELRALAQPLLQNDKAKFSDIIKLLKSTSVRELELNIKESEEDSQQRQLEQIRAQQEAQQQAQQMALQTHQMDIQAQQQLQAQKDAAAMERELVKSFSWAEDKDINDNLVPDVLEVEKFQEELRFKREELKQNKVENQKERDSKEKIAQINARKSKSQSK